MTIDILDVTCGSRALWFDKAAPGVLYIDQRHVPAGGESSYAEFRPNWNVTPDALMDFRDLAIESDTMRLVVFDPPHIIRDHDPGPRALTSTMYGWLNKSTWKDDIRRGFSECFRVLKPGGFLVFKWGETGGASLRDVLALAPQPPLFGNRTNRAGTTIWVVFSKSPGCAVELDQVA